MTRLLESTFICGPSGFDMRLFSLLVTGLRACGGGPVLQNVPRANRAPAAAIAGAATLGAPNSAASRSAEAVKPISELRPMKAGPTVPAAVLDRLDAARERGE
jgi:hypothetical protein